MALLWSAMKEAARAAKGLMSKNARNAAKAEAKKERGPVKAMFHITKNENVPAIEQQGLVANNPNANVNSAYQPFRSVGVKGGGNWVTDRPTAFPVYGTTVGGKHGNEAARRDALTTFKIEFPVSKLPETRAVKNPYGRAKLTTADKGWSPFGTWAGNDVNTMAILEDIDPKYLKNIGYVEELNPSGKIAVTMPEIRWDPRNTLDPDIYGEMRNLSKADRAALSGVTGHDKTAAFNYNREPDLSKSPSRFVEDYLSKHKPINERVGWLPDKGYIDPARDQYTDKYRWMKLISKNENKYKFGPPTAQTWTYDYKPYTKMGEAPKTVTFQPGAYSRGMGHLDKPTKQQLQNRHFNWKTFNDNLANDEPPLACIIRCQTGISPRLG